MKVHQLFSRDKPGLGADCHEGITNFIKRSALLPLLVLAACNALDPYVNNFDRVEVGDTRNEVIAVLGEPASTNRIEVPLIRLESLAWKSPANGR